MSLAPLRFDARDYPDEHQGWLRTLFSSLNGWMAGVTSHVNMPTMEAVPIAVDPANLPVAVAVRGQPAAVYIGAAQKTDGTAVGAAFALEWRWAPTRTQALINIIGLPGLSSGTAYEVVLVIVGG